ncbi:hypothetical protein CIRG_07441 [Coccidioides immitis RMSCC 2394]|uniref:Uncharacterized protein n=1 Tax=Coccidioides immitis RMSCC 2394 TaxID=404692 RepID=A0A0J6YJD5_COCIT|nr:hypothetical protein CIRG_07441 [Coccidioides immitis RMSCC 2394]
MYVAGTNRVYRPPAHVSLCRHILHRQFGGQVFVHGHEVGSVESSHHHHHHPPSPLPAELGYLETSCWSLWPADGKPPRETVSCSPESSRPRSHHLQSSNNRLGLGVAVTPPFTRGRVATNPRWFCSSLNAHDVQRKQKTGTASQDRACMSPPKSWRQPDDKSLLFWKNAPDKASPCNDAHVQNKLHVTPGTPSPGTPFSPPESTCSAPDASLGIDTSKYASRGGSPIQPHGVQTLAQIHTLTHIHIKEENATSESAGFRGVAQSARVREKANERQYTPVPSLLPIIQLRVTISSNLPVLKQCLDQSWLGPPVNSGPWEAHSG